MTRRVLTAIVVLAAVAGGVWWWRWARPAAESVPVASAPAGAVRYQCAMHPQIVSTKPGECPICGMELTPVHDEHATPAPPVGAAVGPVPGRSSFTLSAARQQLIGVRRARVEVRPLRVAVRANGDGGLRPGPCSRPWWSTSRRCGRRPPSPAARCPRRGRAPTRWSAHRPSGSARRARRSSRSQPSLVETRRRSTCCCPARASGCTRRSTSTSWDSSVPGRR